MRKLAASVIYALLIAGCTTAPKVAEVTSGTPGILEIEQVSAHVYQHISYLDAGSFGKVGCNGMVVVDQKEAVIFDTPADSAAAIELIRWAEKDLDCKIVAVVPTHFHTDCLGGLAAFHKHHIPSYGSTRTIALATAHQKPVPASAFNESLELRVGLKKVFVTYFGEGHTTDNVVAYFPDENILFGGCLVKEMGAGKGNLEDANTAAWAATVSSVKAQYPAVKLVIPGHGKAGGTALLDYTINLFKQH